MAILRTLSFWKFASPNLSVKEVEILRKNLLNVWKPLNVYGRIYVAGEGINAQVSVPARSLVPFYRTIRSEPFLEDISLNIEPTIHYNVPIDSIFHRLGVKTRNQIITDTSNSDSTLSYLDLKNAGEEIEPMKWHNMVKHATNDDTIILDCRNEYEQNVGIFKGSKPLTVSKYSESFKLLDMMEPELKGKKNVLIYCTGGIRCIKIGAYMKQKLNVDNVGMLKGGINAYSKFLKKSDENSMFLGSNFVFDNRIGVLVGDSPVSNCIRCNKETIVQQNCSNPCCNRLIVICDSCNKKEQGTCSDECKEYHELDDEKQKQIRKECGSIVSNTENFDCRKDRYPIYKNVLSQYQKRCYCTVKLNNFHAMDVVEQTSNLFEYAFQNSIELPEILNDIESKTKENFPSVAHNMCGKHIAQYLSFLVKTNKYYNILELGSFTGYSTVALLSSITKNDGILHSCDNDSKYANITRENIELFLSKNLELKHNIQIHSDNAENVIEELAKDKKVFDFIFIDANKKSYKKYYDFILENNMLLPNGMMVFDNILFKSEVLKKEEPETNFRLQKIGKSLSEFTEMVKNDKRTIQYILPIRDGLLQVALK